MTTTSAPIRITQTDHDKLTALIGELRPATGPLPDNLQFLSGELDRAEITDAAQISSDVVTLYSRARIVEEDSGDSLEYTLVPPDEADVASGKLSILSPLGTAMLGYRVGDTFSWPTPDGSSCRARVDSVLFQPEENGRQHEAE